MCLHPLWLELWVGCRIQGWSGHSCWAVGLGEASDLRGCCKQMRPVVLLLLLTALLQCQWWYSRAQSDLRCLLPPVETHHDAQQQVLLPAGQLGSPGPLHLLSLFVGGCLVVYTEGRKAVQKWGAKNCTISFHHRTVRLKQINTDSCAEGR